MKQTFSKEERLFEKKLMEQLFKGGKSFFVFPFKVFYYVVTGPAGAFPAKVLISVPKRNFKKAADRNRIKRLVREAYRRNKAILGTSQTEKEGRRALLIGLIYTPKVHMDYKEIERKIILILQQLKKHEQASR